MTTTTTKRFALTALQMAAATLVLSACGGGGSDAPVTPPVVVPPAALAISGTAATGAAMAGANVQVKCVGGTGSATSAPDGTYSTSVTGGALPCVLSATSSDGKTTLRSVAPAGTSTTVVANVTPLTEIIAAQIAGGDAAALFTTFDANAQAKLTTGGVTTAITAVTSALQGTVDLTGLNPLTDALVAANGSKTGNALDQKLDALGAALKAGGTTVADVAAALVANPTAPAVVQGLLKPAATSCAALRSGTFHTLDPYNGTAPVSTRVIDAVALTLTKPDATVKTLTPVDGSACAFTTDNGTTSVYVASSGVMVLRYAQTQSVSRAMLMVPDQTIPLAELAGTWNISMYGAEKFGDAFAPYYSVQTLDSATNVTAGSDCTGLDACVAWIPRASDVLVASTDGGFTQTDPEGTSARVFAVKTASGQIALFGMLLDEDKKPRGWTFFSKQAALTLPALGQVENFWDVEINYNGASTPVDVQTTVATVDSTALSYTRTRASDGRIDGYTVNKPRNGMRYRPAGTSASNTGGTIKFSESLTTPLKGFGLTLYSSIDSGAGNYFGVSVGKP